MSDKDKQERLMSAFERFVPAIVSVTKREAEEAEKRDKERVEK